MIHPLTWVFIVFIALCAVWCLMMFAYVRGYKKGADYGMKKLEEYHAFTLNNVKMLGEIARSRRTRHEAE